MDVVSFKETTENYSVIFLDAYGVLKSSTGLIDGALETVTSLIASGKEVFVVTNDSSRSPESRAERYAQQAGGELLPAERYISSGLLAAEYLEKQIPYGKVAYLGKPESAHYVEIAGKIPVPIADCTVEDNLVAIVLLDTEAFHWFPDQRVALAEFFRVLKPGGRLLVSLINPPLEVMSRITRRGSRMMGQPLFWPTRSRMRKQTVAAGFRVESQRKVFRLPAGMILPSVLTVAVRPD